MGQGSTENVKIVKFLDDATWRDFVDRHPQGNIFHTPELFHVFEQAHGHRPMLHAAVGRDGQVLALLPTVQVSLMNGILQHLTTRSIAYGGVLCQTHPANQSALIGLLHGYLNTASRQAVFTELRNLSDQSLIQTELSECGFAYEEHLNYLIDLDCPTDQLLQRIGSRTRQHIRRGLRKGNVIVEHVTDHNRLKDWYDIVQRTYKAARVPLADRSLFDAAFNILHPRGMIRFWLARIGQVYVAASAELLYKDVIYGWYGGVDRAYGNEMPGELLMWYILEWGAMNGYKVYDFGGAGKPGEESGVRDFKAKFGGQLVCYGRNKGIHSPKLLKLSEQGYRLYRYLLGYF